MRKTIYSFFTLFIFGGIMVGLTSCGGNESSDKARTDTAATAPVAVKTVKKKGKTSVTYAAATTGKIMKDAHGVYDHVDVDPEFPGGKDALSNYINNHLTYPESAIDSNITGTIHVSFVVDETGKVLNPQVMDNKTLNQGLDDETLKMFSNMPAWKPGTVKGKNVKTRMELPVTFQLDDTQ